MKRRTGSVLQRLPSSLGGTPDISMPRVKIPPGGAVAVGEREPGLVERLHHTGLPRDADSAARQHERTPWFVGHES